MTHYIIYDVLLQIEFDNKSTVTINGQIVNEDSHALGFQVTESDV